jgi:prolyl-tRNA synthetase
MREKWENAFSQWYNDIIERAKIIDVRYPIKGLYVWFPYGFKIRGNLLKIIRRLLDETGHEEALFPLLIPEQEFEKEAVHIKGFENEVYWVTHGGTEPLNVKLALRPTSETAIYPMFKVWIRAHTDMPFKVYQIVNTFRYETKHTRPLIRLREITTFKEAHTVHSSYEDAGRQVKEAITIYKKFFDALGIPYVVSRRPDWDKFPGADYTMAFDTMFPDGKTLQIGTVHNLGQTFSKTFDIQFENLKGEQEYAYQTCYGISDRVLASLLTVHGDDKGLCLIPEIAPIQCAIIPIWFKGNQEGINAEVRKVKEELGGSGESGKLRVHIDDRDIRPGSKFFDWEISGVPLRIEVGPKDIDKNQVMTVRRDTGKKEAVSRDGLKESIERILEDITKNLKTRAKARLDDSIHDADSIRGAGEIIKRKGIVRALWCGEKSCAEDVEERVATDILGILEEEQAGNCIGCQKEARYRVLLAKKY